MKINGVEVPELILQYLGNDASAFSAEQRAYDKARSAIRSEIRDTLRPSEEDWGGLEMRLAHVHRLGLDRALALFAFQFKEVAYRAEDILHRTCTIIEDEEPPPLPRTAIDVRGVSPRGTDRLEGAIDAFWEEVLSLGPSAEQIARLQRPFRAALEAGVTLVVALAKPSYESIEKAIRDAIPSSPKSA